MIDFKAIRAKNKVRLAELKEQMKKDQKEGTVLNGRQGRTIIKKVFGFCFAALVSWFLLIPLAIFVLVPLSFILIASIIGAIIGIPLLLCAIALCLAAIVLPFYVVAII